MTLLLALAGLRDAGGAEPDAAGPTDPRITPGQVIDGWTGRPIPCRCRFRGETFRLGEIVCMSTHLGTVLTRCELFLNNTSWMPTREPCTLSMTGSMARPRRPGSVQPGAPLLPAFLAASARSPHMGAGPLRCES